ncbi:hydrolase [Butyricicoccus sp.]|uniref:hydrolase n=1 Tax=Butyricicoccus sp. TaxID=2049021 RepID=UPI003D7DB7DB
MRLKKETTMVLAVDYQEKLMPAMHNKDAFIPRTCLLLKGLKALDIPMIASEQYPKGLGSTVPEIKEVMGTVPYLPKTTFSCMDDAGLRTAVEATACDTVLLCGAELHICVLQTAMDLIEMGKKVVLVEDCVGSRTAHDMEIGLIRAQQEGVLLTTAEAVLFELLKNASGPVFKTISKLVK